MSYRSFIVKAGQHASPRSPDLQARPACERSAALANEPLDLLSDLELAVVDRLGLDLAGRASEGRDTPWWGKDMRIGIAVYSNDSETV